MINYNFFEVKNMWIFLIPATIIYFCFILFFKNFVDLKIYLILICYIIWLCFSFLMWKYTIKGIKEKGRNNKSYWPSNFGSVKNNYHLINEDDLNKILANESIYFDEVTDIGEFWITNNNLISKIDGKIKIMNKYCIKPQFSILWSKKNYYFRNIDCKLDSHEHIISINATELYKENNYKKYPDAKYTISFFSENKFQKNLSSDEYWAFGLYSFFSSDFISREKLDNYANPDWNTVSFCNISNPYEVYKALIKE